MPAPSLAPVRIAVTTPFRAGVSSRSTSLSLMSTLPVALLPAVPLAMPPASKAVPLSSLATGASLTPLMRMLRTAVSVKPLG